MELREFLNLFFNFSNLLFDAAHGAPGIRGTASQNVECAAVTGPPLRSFARTAPRACAVGLTKDGIASPMPTKSITPAKRIRMPTTIAPTTPKTAPKTLPNQVEKDSIMLLLYRFLPSAGVQSRLLADMPFSTVGTLVSVEHEDSTRLVGLNRKERVIVALVATLLCATTFHSGVLTTHATALS